MTGRLSVLAVVLATGAVQCFPAMPGMDAWLMLIVGVGALSLGLLIWQRRSLRRSVPLSRLLLPLWAFVLGLLITAARVELRLADELAPGNENQVSRVVLRVAGLVRIQPDSRQFEADVISSRPDGVPSRIQVSWSAPGRGGPYGRFNQDPFDFPELVPGQLWRMSLTLKKPHGARNPHAFDYESYMFAQGVRATGRVRGTPLYLGDEPWADLPTIAQRARHRVRERMQPYLEGKRYGAVLLALTIGDQASVDQSDWDVFNRTGITHLVSISGSHITMIAALGGTAVLWGWRRLRFRGKAPAERMPAQIAAALAALLIAWLYCLLAGWGVPARRTFLMLSVIAVAHMLRLPLNVSRLLSLVAFAVVVLDPWALLASGFWLSFGAVYVLMASPGWWGRAFGQPGQTRLRRMGRFLDSASRLQLAITVGLMPLLALVFHQVSLASPLANSYAIPVISLIVTPLSLLLAAVAFIPGLDWLASAIAWLGHSSLYWIMQPTVWLAKWQLASFDAAAAPAWMTMLALAGLFVAVMPYGLPQRRMAWLLMLPALFWQAERPEEGGWAAHALDVGQSSAIVIQTARHALLFDTGLRSSATSDEGMRTVTPFMRARGIKKLDVLVVSHEDIDHAGGVRGVLASMPVEQSYSSFELSAYLEREARLLGQPHDLPSLPRAMSSCQQGHSWQIDGVIFEFLWPPAQPGPSRSVKRQQRNNLSCVLRIQGRHHSILLTGDIGVAQEAALLRAGLGAVDVTMAGHHGSKGSSGIGFVNRVQASHVLAQAGAWNHYGHPSPVVQQRWEEAGARFWRTDQQGAITVHSRASGLRVLSTREADARYWQGR